MSYLVQFKSENYEQFEFLDQPTLPTTHMTIWIEKLEHLIVTVENIIHVKYIKLHLMYVKKVAGELYVFAFIYYMKEYWYSIEYTCDGTRIMRSCFIGG